MTFPFFTIGHSTRSLDSFIELLKLSKIWIVADVRTIPRSRTNPQYNRDVLPESFSGSPDRLHPHARTRRVARPHERGAAGSQRFLGNRAFTITLTTQ